MLKARRIEGGKLPPIRYRLLKEAADVPTLPANATTPLAGLVLPEAVAEKLTPPTLDGKPLTEFLDRPDRVLGALVDWRAVAIRPLANDVNGVAPEDAARMGARGRLRVERLFDLRKVVAEHLHAELAAHASGKHLRARLDRHPPHVGHAGVLELAVHLGDNLHRHLAAGLDVVPRWRRRGCC